MLYDTKYHKYIELNDGTEVEITTDVTLDVAVNTYKEPIEFWGAISNIDYYEIIIEDVTINSYLIYVYDVEGNTTEYEELDKVCNLVNCSQDDLIEEIREWAYAALESDIIDAYATQE